MVSPSFNRFDRASDSFRTGSFSSLVRRVSSAYPYAAAALNPYFSSVYFDK